MLMIHSMFNVCSSSPITLDLSRLFNLILCVFPKVCSQAQTRNKITLNIYRAFPICIIPYK